MCWQCKPWLLAQCSFLKSPELERIGSAANARWLTHSLATFERGGSTVGHHRTDQRKSQGQWSSNFPPTFKRTLFLWTNKDVSSQAMGRKRPNNRRRRAHAARLEAAARLGARNFNPGYLTTCDHPPADSPPTPTGGHSPTLDTVVLEVHSTADRRPRSRLGIVLQLRTRTCSTFPSNYPHAGGECPLRTYRRTVPSITDRRPWVPGNTSTGKPSSTPGTSSAPCPRGVRPRARDAALTPPANSLLGVPTTDWSVYAIPTRGYLHPSGA